MHQWGTNSEYNFPTLGKVEFVSFKLINAGMAGIVGGGGGGGVYSWCFWVGVCCPVLKTLALFQTKIYAFPYRISDLNLKIYTLFQTL